MATGKKTMTREEADKMNQKVMRDYVEKHKGVPQRPVPKNMIGKRNPPAQKKK